METICVIFSSDDQTFVILFAWPSLAVYSNNIQSVRQRHYNLQGVSLREVEHINVVVTITVGWKRKFNDYTNSTTGL